MRVAAMSLSLTKARYANTLRQTTIKGVRHATSYDSCLMAKTNSKKTGSSKAAKSTKSTSSKKASAKAPAKRKVASKKAAATKSSRK